MSQTPEEIQADIERQRAQLALTVDQLGQKLDVKAQTKAKVDDVKVQAKVKADEAKLKLDEVKFQAKVKADEVKVQTKVKADEVKDRATTDEGRPTPEAIGIAAAVALGVVLLVWLRRRR